MNLSYILSLQFLSSSKTQLQRITLSNILQWLHTFSFAIILILIQSHGVLYLITLLLNQTTWHLLLNYINIELNHMASSIELYYGQKTISELQT